jgi:hypothetical protein
VPLGPHWGCEAEALLQPRLYAYHDSAAQEAPGSSSVRALAAAPLRSHAWLPLQKPWQVRGLAGPGASECIISSTSRHVATPHISACGQSLALAECQTSGNYVLPADCLACLLCAAPGVLQAGGVVDAPALLQGSDPALLEPDTPEDADKPQVAVKVPDLAPYLPDTAAAGGGGGGVDASSVPLVRQQHQQDTDTQTAQQLQAAVSGFSSSVGAYNQLLSRPHRMAIRP